MFTSSEENLLLSMSGMFARRGVSIGSVGAQADGGNATAVRVKFIMRKERRLGHIVKGLERVRGMVSVREAAN